VVVPPPTTPQDSAAQASPPDSIARPVSLPDTLSSGTPNTNNLQYHKVKSGENLRQIALRYGVSIEQLMEWNALRTTNIYVGQKLTIYSGQQPVVQQQTTPAPPPPPVKKYYTVRAGDTFGRIAQRHNLTQAQLQRLNPGVRINSIAVGQRIRVK
jgi:LysM repeat protein